MKNLATKPAGALFKKKCCFSSGRENLEPLKMLNSFSATYFMFLMILTLE
jgi:hypothetical protein